MAVVFLMAAVAGRVDYLLQLRHLTLAHLMQLLLVLVGLGVAHPLAAVVAEQAQ